MQIQIKKNNLDLIVFDSTQYDFYISIDGVLSIFIVCEKNLI